MNTQTKNIVRIADKIMKQLDYLATFDARQKQMDEEEEEYKLWYKDLAKALADLDLDIDKFDGQVLRALKEKHKKIDDAICDIIDNSSFSQLEKYSLNK